MNAVNGTGRSALAADLLADLDRSRPAPATPPSRGPASLQVELRISPASWSRPEVSVRGRGATLACGPVRFTCALVD